MLTKKWIRWTAFVLFILCTFALGARIFMVKKNNENMSFNPELANGYSYEEALQETPFDVEELKRHLPGDGSLAYDYVTTLTAPKTIQYYDAIDGNVVYTIEKGDTIALGENFRAFYNTGYGLLTLPTASAEWRLAYPVASYDASNGEPLCYLRESDAVAIAEAFCELNPPFRKMYLNSDYVFGYAHLMDRILYNSGIYQSEHALLPLWSSGFILLIVLDVVFLAVRILPLFCKKKVS